jgi:hypothetical protein
VTLGHCIVYHLPATQPLLIVTHSRCIIYPDCQRIQSLECIRCSGTGGRSIVNLISGWRLSAKVLLIWNSSQPPSADARLTMYPSERRYRPIPPSTNLPPGACQPKHFSRYSIHPTNMGPSIVYHLSASRPPPAAAWLTMYSLTKPCRPIHCSLNSPPGACQLKHCSRYSIHPMNIGPYIVYHLSASRPPSAAAWFTMYPSTRPCRPICRSPNPPPGTYQPKHCSRYSIHPKEHRPIHGLPFICIPAAVGCCMVYNVSIDQPLSAEPLFTYSVAWRLSADALFTI